MEFHEQKILPAVRQIKDLEKLLHSSYEYIVILDIHVGQLKSVISLAKQYCKKVFLHVDLIHGLQSDGHATEYLCQEFRPYGLLSTKASVIMKAKQKVLWQFSVSFNRFECNGEELQSFRKDEARLYRGAPGSVNGCDR